MTSRWNIAQLVLALVVLPAQANAQEWQQFGVKQSGFAFDVPPSFALKQRAGNGKGATFEGEDGAFLSVWGNDLPKRDFKAKI